MKKLKGSVALFSSLITAFMLNTECYALPEELAPSAVSAVLINADTGEVLYEKNADEERAIASTTKIMTALITLESGQLDRRFTVDSMAIRVEGTSMGLRDGDIVTRRALCYGMLLPSGNDAANAAAVSVSGSLGAFAEKMNEKAAALGMTHTHFVTPSGLDANGHYSTARDMAILTRAALKNEEFRAICGLTSASIAYGAPPYQRTLYNSNKLLARYEGCIGVKTGFTDNARRCLVSAARRDGATLIAVTLNAPDDWNDHTRMLDYGFSAVSARDVTPEAFEIEVAGGGAGKISAVPERSVTVGISPENAEKLRTEYYLPAFVYGGISKGERIGTAEIYYRDEHLYSVPLVADADVARAPVKKGFLERLFAA